jgi:probable HAF family extracellular repeat protein
MAELGTLWYSARRQRFLGSSIASAVNDEGTVVGASNTEGLDASFDVRLGPFHAFIAKNGNLQDIGQTSFQSASDINVAGCIVGNMSSPKVTWVHHACLWKDGEITDLGTLGGENSNAVGINNSGHITGSAETTDGREHGFIWRDRKMHVLATLPGYAESQALSINDSDEIVGTVGRIRNDPFKSGHGSWEETNRAAVWQGKKVHLIGTLGGNESEALSINAHGSIVGESDMRATDRAGKPLKHAFLYKKSRLLDLNRLISSRSGWVLTSATAINDHGQIVGKGTYHGQTHGFLLVLKK